MESIIFGLTANDDGKVREIAKLYPNITIGKINRETFSDGESCVDFLTSVRGHRVYILGTLNNDKNIVAMMLAIDAAKRASATEIVPIIPYFPYARQDKKDQVRGPIGAKVMALTFETLGATNLIVFDLHADQIQGFFQIPITHMEGEYLFSPYLKKYIEEKGDETLSNIVLCSPDAGGTKRVKHYRDRMNYLLGTTLPYVMIDKTRAKANVVDEMFVIGDVKGKHVIVIDDMCDTGGTLCKGAEELKKQGALSVIAVVTHGIFSGTAIDKIGDSKGLDKVLTSDTLPQVVGYNNWIMTISERKGHDKLVIESTGDQIVRAIKAIDSSLSVEQLKLE